MLFLPYNQDFVDHVRNGGADANGQPAERTPSNGQGNPCRSCLRDIAKGEEMLILAARPFPAPQPYAETGPIFLHAEACAPWDAEDMPPILATSPDYLVKGYTADDRILYGTGAIVGSGDIAAAVAARLARAEVAFVDIRSARNNCFLTRAIRD